MSRYVVVVEGHEDGGFSAWSPDLPGCVAAAGGYEECVVLMREHGDPIPAPSAAGAFTVTAA